MIYDLPPQWLEYFLNFNKNIISINKIYLDAYNMFNNGNYIQTEQLCKDALIELSTIGSIQKTITYITSSIDKIYKDAINVTSQIYETVHIKSSLSISNDDKKIKKCVINDDGIVDDNQVFIDLTKPDEFDYLPAAITKYNTNYMLLLIANNLLKYHNIDRHINKINKANYANRDRLLIQQKNIHILLACAYDMQHKYTDAISEYIKVIDISPDDNITFRLAFSYYNNDNPALARLCLDMIKGSLNTSCSYLYLSGLIYEKYRLYKEAYNNYKECLDKYPYSEYTDIVRTQYIKILLKLNHHKEVEPLTKK